MSNYLVTGGCGFIGSHLVDDLVAAGHGVRILDDLSTGTLAHKPPGVEFIRGDVAEPTVVADALRDMDGCFHLAAVASVERSNMDWLGTHRTNLAGAVTVFNAARRTALPVVFASSAAVYGDNADFPLSEETRPRPLSAYGADKLGCELHSVVAGRIHQVPTCGLRFFNVYGPRQDPRSPYSGVISIFSDALKTGRGINLHGDGHQSRDFIYVADVVRALVAAMENCPSPGSSNIFNVCTGRPTTIRDLANKLGMLLGTKPSINFTKPRRGDLRRSLGDPAMAHRVLGFQASIELGSGLARTLGVDELR